MAHLPSFVIAGLMASRFQQYYKSVPVFGGELIVHATPENRVTTVIGQLSPLGEFDITPNIGAGGAADRAPADVSRREATTFVGLSALAPEIWIYNPALLKPAMILNSLVWRIEVGSDSSYLDYGWFIDNPWIYTCVSASPRVYVPTVIR